MLTRLSLVILAVGDLPRARRFYEEAFGWTRAVDVPVYVEHALPGGMRVGLYQREGFGHNTGRVPFRVPEGELAPTELYLGVEDLEGAVARAAAAGARLLSPAAPREWGDTVAYLADPDGNVLALARAAGAQ
ncbi:MAG: VOC family protein [Planctomycetes bacterium]|nr:VOC family protein [Planctomycetota bacterium]